jgi:hypothetical protein
LQASPEQVEQGDRFAAASRGEYGVTLADVDQMILTYLMLSAHK